MTPGQGSIPARLTSAVATVLVTCLVIVTLRLVWMGAIGSPHAAVGRYRAELVTVDGYAIAWPSNDRPGMLQSAGRAFDATVRWLERASIDRLTNFDTVSLTLHARVQDEAFRVIEQARVEFDADWIIGLLIDPSDGAIRAACVSKSDDIDMAPETLLFGALAEPGSTLKPLLYAAAIEDGLLDPGEIVSRGSTKMSVAQALAYSSNWASIDIVGRLGEDATISWLERFGLVGNGHGIISVEYGLDGVALGETVGVTPLGLLAAMSAVVDGGQLIEPTIIERPFDSIRPSTVLSTETSRELRRMMLGVTEFGTARSITNEQWPVIGKTGTVQRRAENRAIEAELAWFVGFTPAHDPELGVLIAIQARQSRNLTGGGDAARVAADVLRVARELF